MEYRTLGRTGLRVSAVALGCEGFMHKRAEEVKADFDFAIGHGINFVDIYSSNPDLRADIGAALEGRRGEFIIQGHLCTVWENDQYLRTRDPQKSADSFERQLRQLRTDYLDVGMIHYVDAEADLRTVFDGPIIRLAQRLKAEGRIRSIGLSSHNPAVAAVMVGCKSRAEIEAALAWCDAPAAERDYTAVMTGLERFSWRGHCMYCGHCAPCSAGIDIAAVNKFRNLAQVQGEIPETVREHYRTLAHHASECIGCGLCEPRCPFGVEIVEAMRRAAERFGY